MLQSEPALLNPTHACSQNSHTLPPQTSHKHTHVRKKYRAETEEEREQLVKAVSYLPRLYAVLQEMGSAIPGAHRSGRMCFD